MTEVTPIRYPRRPHRPGRLFPEFTMPSEELARRKVKRDARCDKARVTFERVRPELIDEHYNWIRIID
jgi:hypothetical protein